RSIKFRTTDEGKRWRSFIKQHDSIINGGNILDKFYWLNEDSRLTLERGYLNEGETPEGRIQDIADTAESILGIEGFSDKFYDYMSRGFYSLSSPVWSNYGKSRGFSVSYFGNVRPRGAAITNNGESSGAVHFMELFEQVTDTISQGNTRRGKFTPYLPLEHDDIHEFLDIGTEGNAIQSMTTAVSVTDEWMIEMLNGDKDKRDI